MLKKRKWIGLILGLTLLMAPLNISAKEKGQDFRIPNHVLSISKENTYPNPTANQAVVEPSKLTKELMETIDLPVENPDLIKMLNETTLKPSPAAIGYRAMIYLGSWPLNYKSDATTINWQYKKINTNEMSNFEGDSEKKMHYTQVHQAEIKGALTNQIESASDVKTMMLLKAMQKTKLPLAETAVFGKGTKTENAYSIPVQKHGKLDAYAPAVNEKGEVTFGEVYLELKGSKKALVVKNVTKQGIGAWIPIQDHISFSLQLK